MNTERLNGQYQYGANQMLLADLDQDLGNPNPFSQTLTSAQILQTQSDQNLNESHSVACGNDDVLPAKKESQCNTNNVNTESTGVDAIVNTNEMASQCAAEAKKEQKDQMCSTKVNTETIACQKDTVGDSKEVSCLILHPEEINKLVNKEECI